MAWENGIIATPFSQCILKANYINTNATDVPINNLIYSGDNIIDIYTTQPSTLFNINDFKCSASYGSGWIRLDFYYPNSWTKIATFSVEISSSTQFLGLAFTIDETNHKGRIFYIKYNISDYAISRNIVVIANESDVYTAIKGAAPITYNWQSVPSIKGKNEITLNMSTLNDINDGDEVTTSDTSKFNLNKSSNIKNLVDTVI